MSKRPFSAWIALPSPRAATFASGADKGLGRLGDDRDAGGRTDGSVRRTPLKSPDRRSSNVCSSAETRMLPPAWTFVAPEVGFDGSIADKCPRRDTQDIDAGRTGDRHVAADTDRCGDRGETLGRIGADQNVALGSHVGRRDKRLGVLGDRVDVNPGPQAGGAAGGERSGGAQRS